jgi:hypothetical protein
MLTVWDDIVACAYSSHAYGLSTMRAVRCSQLYGTLALRAVLFAVV